MGFHYISRCAGFIKTHLLDRRGCYYVRSPVTDRCPKFIGVGTGPKPRESVSAPGSRGMALRHADIVSMGFQYAFPYLVFSTVTNFTYLLLRGRLGAG